MRSFLKTVHKKYLFTAAQSDCIDTVQAVLYFYDCFELIINRYARSAGCTQNQVQIQSKSSSGLELKMSGFLNLIMSGFFTQTTVQKLNWRLSSLDLAKKWSAAVSFFSKSR
uniref:(northern house mosquito) hypothetical protein n=1 Tax=Culex pipiens TaxID=7175 RepID=A0A8D8BIX3_CULPI